GVGGRRAGLRPVLAGLAAAQTVVHVDLPGLGGVRLGQLHRRLHGGALPRVRRERPVQVVTRRGARGGGLPLLDLRRGTERRARAGGARAVPGRVRRGRGVGRGGGRRQPERQQGGAQHT